MLAAAAVIAVGLLMIQCTDIQNYRTHNMTLKPLFDINTHEPVVPYTQIPFDCAELDCLLGKSIFVHICNISTQQRV